MSRRSFRWIITAVIAVAIVSVGILLLHKDTDGTKGGNEKVRTMFLTMIEQRSYPEMKKALEDQVGIPVKAIYSDYVSYDEESLKNAKSNQLEISFYDVDADGVEECLVADTIHVYELGSIVLVYKQVDDKIKLLGTMEMATTHEEYTGLLPPFKEHVKGASLLYCNKDKQELYTCSYETGLVAKQINRVYRLEQGKVKQIIKEALPMVEDGKNQRKETKLMDIGKNIPFYSCEDIVGKYRK